MWRIALILSLISSLVLNVYLFMQLNIQLIESNFPQAVSRYSQLPTTQIKKDQELKKSTIRSNALDSPNVIDGTNLSENASNQVSEITAAIDVKDYFNAAYLINRLANDHKSELPQAKLFWLQATKTLIQQKHFTHAENAISAYLSFDPDDSEFLYQQVDLYWQQQLPLLAIKHAYEVQYHVFSEVEIRNKVNFARELVQQQIALLQKNSLWLELRDLVEEVLALDPQNLNLQWHFVFAQYQLGEFEYARNAIEPLLNQPNYKVKAQALLADIEAALRAPQSVPLTRQGEHFIVQALINESFNVSLMLDTGASISLLSEQAFNELNHYSDVIYLKDLTLNTAGGQITASLYQVAEFAIQGYRVNDFVFAVSPFTSEGNDGLLGMNFLKAFDFHIDQKNSWLVLEGK